MSKTRSKIKLCIVAVLTIIGLLLTFVSFMIPTTNTTYRGFFGAINYGYDVGGGRLSIYEANSEDLTQEDLSSRLDETVRKFEKAFSSRGLNVTRQGEAIRIEISNYDDQEITDLLSRTGNSVDLMTLIGSESGISINTSSSDANAEGSITGEYIESCTLGASQADGTGGSYYPVTINFTPAGQELLREMTGSIAGSDSEKLYIYLNGANYNSSGFEMSSAVSEISLYSENQEAAVALQLQVSALAKPISLRMVVDDQITSGLNTSNGVFFGNIQVLTYVAFGAILLATILFLLIRYRMLGLLATMSIGIFISIFAFLLQSIPLVLMDLNGLLGVMFTYILLVVSMIEIFERIRFEYKSGKKIPNSVMSAFRKKTLNILEKYVFLVILSAIFYLVGGAGLRAFAVVLFVGLFVNYFVLFVALRGTCYSYINVNSTRKNFYNLKREGVKNEI